MSLLLELQELREEKKLRDTSVLVESVDKMLGHLFADFSHGIESMEKLNDEDVKELANKIGGLILLAKADERASFTDFSRVDAKGVSRMYYKFLSEIDEANQPRDFEDGATADSFLQFVGKSSNKGKSEEWAEIINDAKSGDEAAFDRLKKMIQKMHKFYTDVLSKLKRHLDQPKSSVSNNSDFDTD